MTTLPSHIPSARSRLWWVLWVNGLMLILGGLMLIAVPIAATFAWLFIFGIMLAVAGVMGLFGAFTGLAHGVRSVMAFVGPLVALILGILFVDAPVLAAETLTEFAGAFAIIGGAAIMATALGMRTHDGWIALFFNGILMGLAGILIVSWPAAAIFVFAIFFGVQLVFSGFRMCAMGHRIRR